MLKRIVYGMMLTLLLIGMLTLAFNSKVVEVASEGRHPQKSSSVFHTDLGSSLPPPQWNKTYGGTNKDWLSDVIQTNDGGYAIAGWTKSFGADISDFWLIKTDGAGNAQWNKTYRRTDRDCSARAVVQTLDGGYAIVGETYYPINFWLVKTDSNGNMEWNKTYGGKYPGYGKSLVQTIDGGYAIAGDKDDNFWLVKTDSNGNMEWNKTYQATYASYGDSLVQTIDGGYAIVGYTLKFGVEPGTVDRDIWLVRTDSDGNMQWNKTYGGPYPEGFDSFLIHTDDGGYAIASYTRSFGAGFQDFWLVKTDSDGNMQWNKTYGGVKGDEPFSVCQTIDGGYVMVGLTDSFDVGNYDFWLVRTDSDGNMQWNKTYGGTDRDVAWRVIQTIDKGYAIGGYTESFGAGGGDFWLIKLGPEVHDIAVNNVTSSKTVVGQGFPLNINVTAANEGHYAETFNVTAYANTTQIGKKTVINLNSGENKILGFIWNTTDWTIGNYNISAVVDVVANETDTLDNTYIDGIVTIRLPIHDVAVVDVSPASNVVTRGFDLNVSVTVENQGDFMETFNVTAYYDDTAIILPNGKNYTTATLTSGKSITIIFTWDTTDVTKTTHTISAYAWPVLNETDTADNLYVDGIVQVVGTGWTTSFIGSGGYPIVDFAVYNEKLYAASDNTLYTYNGSSWNIINAPTYVLSLKPFEDRLIIGGKGGLYSYNGTAFTLIFTVSNYIKSLGIYNNTLYAGTVLDKPPILYYCNGSAENPDNWHVDTAFSAILNFSGPFGSIDSFTVYNNNMYVSSGGTVYSYNGTHWNITKICNDVCAYLDMKVYNDRLYLATRDQAWRKPHYKGYSGFSGRVIEFDGDNWTTLFDHDYWIFSLETYGGKLYIGTANEIYTYNGTYWDTSFNSEEEGYYAISLITFNNTIYAGMGNGYIFVDPSPETLQSETAIVPEFPSFIILPLFMLTMIMVVLIKNKKRVP